MSSKVLSALGLVLIVGCQSEAPRAADQGSPSAALQALTARDDAALAQCGRAVENCNERRPDAAPADVCQRLADHCDQLQAHLAEVRKPAVGCLKAVQACEEHAPDAARCSSDPASCEPLNTGADEDGATVIECSSRVEACLARVAELPESAGVSCENISAACERVATLVAAAGQARADGADNASDIAKQARDELGKIADDDGEEDVDEEDIDEEDVDEPEPNDDAKPVDLPDAGAARARPARPDRTDG